MDKRFDYLKNHIETRLLFGPQGIDSETVSLVPPPFNYLETEMIKAVINRDHDRIKSLLLQGRNPNSFQDREISPLHWAIYLGDLEAVNLLINRKRSYGLFYAEVNRVCMNVSPLMLALYQGNGEITKELIKEGAQLDKLISGLTPLSVTILFERNREYHWLMDTQAVNLEKNKDLLFLQAVKKRDRELQETLWNLQPSLDIQDRRGYTSLMYAVENDDLELVEKLLKKGANITLYNYGGKTAYDIASSQKCEQIIKHFRKYYSRCFIQ